jgi:hypothetical protein
MWKFLLGLSSGIYVGTFYECKPIIKNIKKIFKDHFPEKK